MTRVGKKPIILESNVQVTQNGEAVSIEGPAGKISLSIPADIAIKVTGSNLEVIGKNETVLKNIQGLFRSLLQNAVTGVKNPWKKTLELVGVGYRAQTTGTDLELNLGFSHPIKIKAPQGLTFSISENKITVTGADKYLVGEVAASIRRVKPPEPYKGKGIRYEKEYIRKKLGKAAKAVGAPAAK